MRPAWLQLMLAAGFPLSARHTATICSPSVSNHADKLGGTEPKKRRQFRAYSALIPEINEHEFLFNTKEIPIKCSLQEIGPTSIVTYVGWASAGLASQLTVSKYHHTWILTYNIHIDVATVISSIVNRLTFIDSHIFVWEVWDVEIQLSTGCVTERFPIPAGVDTCFRNVQSYFTEVWLDR